MQFFIAVLALILITPAPGQAEVLFEGYYRIENKGQHIGYLIQRHSIDKKGNRSVTAYIRMRDEAGTPDSEVFESYQSVAKAGSGSPVWSRFESTRTGERDLLKTEFDKKGFAQITEIQETGGKSESRKDISVGAPFLSGMLLLVTDFAKLQENKIYQYDTYVEERGHVSEGHVFYAGKKSVSGITIAHIADNLMGQTVELFATPAGESLGSRSWNGEGVTYWVAKREDAIGSFKFPTAELTQTFGDLPEGKKNPWSKSGINAAAVIKTFTRPNIPGSPSNPKIKPLTLPRRKL